MILHKIARAAQRIAELIQPMPFSQQRERVIPWFKDNGDKTLRLNYEDLNEKSLVFDLGGYEGQWASDIYSKYRCRILIFEPNYEYAKNIRSRFSKNGDIQIFDIGLSGNSQDLELTISNDASSVYIKDGKKVMIRLEKASDFLHREGITIIDLMKINIEGGEYDLLDHLISTKLILHIKNIQVQFHDFVPDAYNRMKKIQRNLSESHKLTYQYEFVWENWSLKN